ncbi:MAG: hypothetical protein O3A85_02955 [Proteobacteria bacterium]|nr:hypothetical protein [Pseudomonadota bacterium]
MTAASRDSVGSPARAPVAEEHSAFSVFEGLTLAGVTLPMIASFCDTETSEIDAWRKGDVQAPMGRVVFLTMVLSHMVDELVRTYNDWGPASKAWYLHMQACLEKGKKILVSQEAQNQGAPAGAFRQGERFFEEWLDRDAVKGWSNEAASRVALGTDTTGIEF